MAVDKKENRKKQFFTSILILIMALAGIFTSSQEVFAASSSDSAFESYMNSQGFPESYKPYLRTLHEQYPNWVFKSAQTGLSWDEVIRRESKIGTSLVAASSPVSWKSTEKGAYDPDTNTYISYDSGGWVCASESILKYYMDPRNFLNSSGVFQFLSHDFDSSSQNVSGLQTILSGTFMEGEFPEDTHATYADALMDAGQQAGVNPYVLASMILIEQGSRGGGGCISGTVSGYEGYYNYFNVGAYKTSTMSAVTRGVWYASQSGVYGRPWDSRYKSIAGGASFYGQNYVSKGKNTQYFKKWNVMNGSSNVGSGQYMTNIQGAESEAAALRKGYTQIMDSSLMFSIPVYENMPTTACKKPSGGDTNNYLKSLKIAGYTLTPDFSMYTTNYELVVDKSVSSVTISASADSSEATVSGIGKITLSSNNTRAAIVVKAGSGEIRTYYVTISKANNGQTSTEEPVQPTLALSGYTLSGSVYGVTPETSYTKFKGKVVVKNGTFAVLDSSSKSVTSGNIATGMTLAVYNTAGKKTASYQIVVKGDINGDGKINSADPLSIQKHIIGTARLKDAYLEAADINEDGRINSLDVLYTQKHIIGSYKIG